MKIVFASTLSHGTYNLLLLQSFSTVYSYCPNSGNINEIPSCSYGIILALGAVTLKLLQRGYLCDFKVTSKWISSWSINTLTSIYQ